MCGRAMLQQKRVRNVQGFTDGYYPAMCPADRGTEEGNRYCKPKEALTEQARLKESNGALHPGSSV